MRIIWLASYPKTGGTYLSSLLYNYFYGTAEKSAEISETIHDIHDLSGNNRGLNLELDRTLFVKGHFKYSDMHPYLDNIVAFIYLLRNPRDVLLSNAKFMGATKSAERLRAFAKEFIDELGAPYWKTLNMGSMPENFGSWLTAVNRYPHLFIKYEELRLDPVKTMEKIVLFCDPNVDKEKIKKTLDICNIENSRKIELSERAQGVEGLYPRLPGDQFFVGEGKMGQSLSHIGEDIEEYYQKRFGRFLNVMGYE